MAMYIENNTNYSYIVKHIKNITFSKLREVAVDFTRRLPSSLTDELYEAMQHGVCQLQDEPILNMYIHSFGRMHEAKLQHAFNNLPSKFTDYEAIEIIDYGCGQAIGTICYADFLRKIGKSQKVRKVTLIEPSRRALERAALHTSCFFPQAELITINKGFDELNKDDLCVDEDLPTLHIFSNVLDLAGRYFNLDNLANLIRTCSKGNNHYICIGPYFGYEDKDEAPYRLLQILGINPYYKQVFPKGAFSNGQDWTCHIVNAENTIYNLGANKAPRNVSETVHRYRKYDERGKTNAQYYYLGNGLEQYEAELEWSYRQDAAENGDADAQYKLGLALYHPRNLFIDENKDNTEAVYWLRKAAEQGHAKAQLKLSSCYYYGDGVEKDKTAAIRWCLKAAEQGHRSAIRSLRNLSERDDKEAQFSLGYLYYCGVGVDVNTTEAIRWYQKAAEQGHVEAQYELGCCYYNGIGVERDYTVAVQWFYKAAEQGHAEAQCNLACCYYFGEGIELDETNAVKWYRKAAEQGDAEAQCNLGHCYYNGLGVEVDYAETILWYSKAAAQGYAPAQYQLGLFYEIGEVVHEFFKTDYAKAVWWYRKAAEQGLAEAQYHLGDCYYNGMGVEHDYAVAVQWYRKAAEQGLADAQHKLGDCYKYGKGVEQNEFEANCWYHKSVEQGYSEDDDLPF